MDKYTASNGVIVHRDAIGRLAIGNYRAFTTGEEDTLREFFQAERDEQLGRWRWPENPDVIIRDIGHEEDRSARRIEVYDEASGEQTSFASDTIASEGGSSDWYLTRAAIAYFAAHPEPKPWHDAKEGEIWVVESDGEEFAAYVDRSPGFPRFIDPVTDMSHGYKRVTAGRRIWPEEDPS